MAKEGKKKEAPDADGAVGLGVLKELTSALLAHRHSIAAWMNLIGEKMDQEAALIGALSELEGRITTLTLMLSRWDYVLDRVVDVYKGKPEEKPPIKGRVPEMDDIAAALLEFDENVDREVEKSEEEVANKQTTGSPMFTNTAPAAPRLEGDLPPLPKVDPLPKV